MNSTELSRTHDGEVIRISFVTSPESQIVTIESDSKESTMLYGYGHQQLIVPPSLNDINLPAKPFNVFATVTVIQPDEE